MSLYLSDLGWVDFDGYMEDDLMEIDLKSIFRAISSLENLIMIQKENALMDNDLIGKSSKG